MKEINVATYNVRTDTEEDGMWAWDYRKKEVLSLIRYHDWDIFGVQEVLPNQVKDLAKLSGYTSYCVEREGDFLGEGLGVYFKTEEFDCLDKGFFWLSTTPDEPSIHPEAGCKRIALWLILKDKATKKEFLLINTHLDHISETARKEGMKVILKRLEDKIMSYPTLLMGDFNAEKNESIHEFLQEKFVYPMDQENVMVYGPKGTFQEFKYNINWSELEEIDYILFRELTCLKYGVLTDSCDRRFPSDHFPVVVTFKL